MSELSAITPERQPLATLTRNLLCSDRLRQFGGDPPARKTGGGTGWGSSLLAGLLGGDPMPAVRRMVAGLRAMDRAWPIVVHPKAAHKGVRYQRVTAR
ncbi:hypothetical protein GCM10012287_55570 [Streptomyces daqingensis]|uniref:Uncharacterized protein n=1 Tax=Streptomyces daqingensis TaxID=1472640 RepID=A0ABQ2MUC2_9ACTN|nr:hypothetical protein GCM10012287_55570 [Streptomyces daqingensis]